MSTIAQQRLNCILYTLKSDYIDSSPVSKFSMNQKPFFIKIILPKQLPEIFNQEISKLLKTEKIKFEIVELDTIHCNKVIVKVEYKTMHKVMPVIQEYTEQQMYLLDKNIWV